MDTSDTPTASEADTENPDTELQPQSEPAGMPTSGVDPEELREKLHKLQKEKGISEQEEQESEDMYPGAEEVETSLPLQVPRNTRLSEDTTKTGEETEDGKRPTEILVKLDDFSHSVISLLDPPYTTEEIPMVYGNMRLPLTKFRIIELPRKKQKEDILSVIAKEVTCDGEYDPESLKMSVESVWWKTRPSCGKCPTAFNCTCNRSLTDMIAILTESFDAVLIQDKWCNACFWVGNRVTFFYGAYK